VSRQKRRASLGRSRRTPVKASGGGGLNVPWTPIVVVLGLVAVVGLVGYLIWQISQPAGEGAGVSAEANDDPTLPGEWVDLPFIYGGSYSATAPHVRRDVDYEADQGGLPPVGGPHWGTAGACPNDPEEAPTYCGPAPWGIYDKPWRMESVVHNMEHAGVILWYNTTDQAIIDELEEFIEGRLNRGQLLVMLPLPEMEEETIALTGWSRREKFPVSEYTEDRVKEFIDTHERRFNPEGF
jgi:hypothetical protein